MSRSYCWAEAVKNPGTSFPLLFPASAILLAQSGGGYPVLPLIPREGEIHLCQVKPLNFRFATAA